MDKSKRVAAQSVLHAREEWVSDARRSAGLSPAGCRNPPRRTQSHAVRPGPHAFLAHLSLPTSPAHNHKRRYTLAAHRDGRQVVLLPAAKRPYAHKTHATQRSARHAEHAPSATFTPPASESPPATRHRRGGVSGASRGPARFGNGHLITPSTPSFGVFRAGLEAGRPKARGVSLPLARWPDQNVDQGKKEEGGWEEREGSARFQRTFARSPSRRHQMGFFLFCFRCLALNPPPFSSLRRPRAP
jgi:hypothetical protein